MSRNAQKTKQKNGKIVIPLAGFELKKSLFFLFGVVLLIVLAAAGIYVYRTPSEVPKDPGTSPPTVGTFDIQSREHPSPPGPKAPGLGHGNRPLYEVFDKAPGSSSAGRRRAPGPEGTEGLPRVAIIIDDVGFDMAMAMAFSRLSHHITMAILPESPFGRTIADRLYVRDIEVMLHLPMEPMQYPAVNPGPGALMAAMSPDLLLKTLRSDLDCIPHIKGVNNHMGSRLTTLPDHMRQVFSVLKKRDLFFIDSLTAGNSICRDSARLFRLPFAMRDVFLDNIQERTYITGQINELIRISQRHGSAIGIGHPYPATLKTLTRMLPKMEKKVCLVKASDLVSISD